VIFNNDNNGGVKQKYSKILTIVTIVNIEYCKFETIFECFGKKSNLKYCTIEYTNRKKHPRNNII
jgi:hypothetical protein